MLERIKLKYIEYNYYGKLYINIFWDWIEHLQ